ncbi:hypothetical protein MRS44_003379 [Fusarium solani]|uniref:uncharacterized protein n=1 Tax=Fusarium solani TaxID=169388 RepID=UPI0032C4596A|nr:hypothetical protein MRS44_003379 [Fusarium solani]
MALMVYRALGALRAASGWAQLNALEGREGKMVGEDERSIEWANALAAEDPAVANRASGGYRLFSGTGSSFQRASSGRRAEISEHPWMAALKQWIHISGYAERDPGPATDLRQPAPGNVPARAPDYAPDPGSFDQWEPAKDNF